MCFAVQNKSFFLDRVTASLAFYTKKNGKPVWTGNSSGHGQKGTIGLTLNHQDMPYNRDGITPDIIMNPHCMPSRMTIAQLLEGLCGMIGAITGKIQDGTPFEPVNVEELMSMLHELGYEKHGWQRLYHGYTSKPIDALVFKTPVYYQRLKHMVNDKMHSRSYGPLQTLTRQPLEGRAREGGLRFGEMERDKSLFLPPFFVYI